MGEARGGQTVGIISPKTPPKRHQCRPPFWTWFRKWDTLYRCPCGRVYILVPSGYMGEDECWSETTIEEWEKAGGTRR